MNKILDGAREAVAVAKGEQAAAAIWHNGHRYVPEAVLDKAIREDQAYMSEMSLTIARLAREAEDARRSALLEAAEVADRIGSEWEGCEDWSGNQSIEVAVAIRSLADGEEKKG